MTETSVVFETATLADALKKAEACAPRMSADSQAFGSAAGIVLRIRPGEEEPIRVSSTNLDIFYDEWITPIEITGPAADWRIPVSKFTGIIGALPIGVGKTVQLTSEGRALLLASARTRGRVGMIDMSGYQQWDPYDDEGSVVVPNLGAKLAQVAWACADKEEPFTGIYFDGRYALAANRWRCAMVPCEIPVLAEAPVTVPAKLLTPILRHAGDVRVGLEGNMLTISPDDYTQIRCRVFGTNIPRIDFVSTVYDSYLSISRDLLIDTVKRMMNITKGRSKEEIITVTMLIGGGTITLRVESADRGEWVEDVIQLISGQGEHLPVTLNFYPDTLIDSVNKAPDEQISLSYNSALGAKNSFVRIDGGAGYMSWFVQWKTGKAK